MQIYLDIANIDQIRRVAKLDIISGVTTNPTMMSSGYKTLALQIGEEINRVDGL